MMGAAGGRSYVLALPPSKTPVLLQYSAFIHHPSSATVTYSHRESAKHLPMHLLIASLPENRKDEPPFLQVLWSQQKVPL